MHFFMFMYYFSWSSRVLNVCGSCIFQFLWRFYLDYYGFSCTFKIGVILHIIFRAFVYYKIACYSDWIEVLIFWVWQHWGSYANTLVVHFIILWFLLCYSLFVFLDLILSFPMAPKIFTPYHDHSHSLDPFFLHLSIVSIGFPLLL